MKVYCTVNTYGEELPAGHMPLKNDLEIELSNKYNGFAEMKIGDEVFYVYVEELKAAIDCMRNELRYRC